MHRTQTVGPPITFFVIVVSATLTTSACSAAKGPTVPSASSSASSSSPAVALSLAVAGFTSLDTKGQRGRLSAMATYSDGSVQDRSSAAVWSSSNEAVATIDTSGMVTAVTDGRTIVTATFENVSGTRTIHVDLP